MAKQQTLHCSFCGRNRDEVKILIAGQEGHICENCIEHAQEIILQEILPQENSSASNYKLSVMMLKLKKAISLWWVKPEPAKHYWQKPSPVF